MPSWSTLVPADDDGDGEWLVYDGWVIQMAHSDPNRVRIERSSSSWTSKRGEEKQIITTLIGGDRTQIRARTKQAEAEQANNPIDDVEWRATRVHKLGLSVENYNRILSWIGTERESMQLWRMCGLYVLTR